MNLRKKPHQLLRIHLRCGSRLGSNMVSVLFILLPTLSFLACTLELGNYAMGSRSKLLFLRRADKTQQGQQQIQSQRVSDLVADVDLKEIENPVLEIDDGALCLPLVLCRIWAGFCALLEDFGELLVEGEHF